MSTDQDDDDVMPWDPPPIVSAMAEPGLGGPCSSCDFPVACAAAGRCAAGAVASDIDRAHERAVGLEGAERATAILWVGYATGRIWRRQAGAPTPPALRPPIVCLARSSAASGRLSCRLGPAHQGHHEALLPPGGFCGTYGWLDAPDTIAHSAREPASSGEVLAPHLVDVGVTDEKQAVFDPLCALCGEPVAAEARVVGQASGPNGVILSDDEIAHRVCLDKWRGDDEAMRRPLPARWPS